MRFRQRPALGRRAEELDELRHLGLDVVAREDAGAAGAAEALELGRRGADRGAHGLGQGRDRAGGDEPAVDAGRRAA